MQNPNTSTPINKYVKTYAIFLILALAFALRAKHVDAPVIGVHSWRQADTAAIARNYHENGYRLLYPQIDWGGEGPGYVESEFPIVSYAIALTYKLFGVSESYGRMMSVFFSLMSILFLYLFVKKHIDESTALWSAFFFSVLPLNIFFSRTIQPESALIMSLVAGIYFFSRWITSDKMIDYLVSVVFISLACLIKPPSLYIGLPLLYLAWIKHGNSVLKERTLWLYLLLVLLPVGLWYYHSHQLYLNYGNTFGIWEYGSDKWGNWGLAFSPAFIEKVFLNNLAGWFLTWGGALVFLIGLFLKRQTQEEKVFDFWIISLLVYLVIVAKGNYVHEYYQLPLMIPAAVYIGKVYSRWFTMRTKIAATALLLCLLSILVFSQLRYLSYIQHEDTGTSEVYSFAEIVKGNTDEGSLIISVSPDDDPTFMYLAHRKGWLARSSNIDGDFLNGKIQNGAKYIVGNHRSFNETEVTQTSTRLLRLLRGSYEVIYNDGKSFIVRISDV
jgi:4-amino-4-deoxy-L-arabinose transferase-like glycosyltransferase